MKRARGGGISAGLVLAQVGPVLLYVGLIFTLSSMQQAALSPAVSWLRIPHADKLLHLTEYACLGALGLRALHLDGHGLRPGRALLAMLALGALCGLCDELYQASVPTRDSSLGDWLADLGGVSSGALIARLILGRRATLSAGPRPPAQRESAARR